MERVQLFYKDLSEIVGSNGFAVARLTDAEEQRALSVICDKPMADQLSIRTLRRPDREQMLPEVLISMLQAEESADFELMVYDVVDGQYRVTLLNRRTLSLKHIRMSDAVLMHIIARVPIFISEALLNRQCSSYHPGRTGISIPINTIDLEHLHKELKRAIEAEDYRLASHLHEEIQRRNKA